MQTKYNADLCTTSPKVGYRFKRFSGITATAIGTICAVFLNVDQAAAQDTKLVLQSSESNPDSLVFLAQQAWAASISSLTNGEVAVEIALVDSIIPRLDTLLAIKRGELDGHITSTAYFNALDPAFGLIGDTVGAWSSPEEMLEFMDVGGGREFMDVLLLPYNAHFVGGMTPGLEAFVSNVPINGIDDLVGLSMRAPEGMVTSVFSELGVKTQNLGLDEVKTGLAGGSLNMSDYSVFSVNAAVGLHDVAKHPIYPGFHSMPLLEFSVNKDIWEGISVQSQAVVTSSFSEFSYGFAADVRAADIEAIEAAEKDPSITIHDWAPEERNRFRVIALEKWNAVTYESDLAIQAYEAVTAFLWEKGRLN